MLEQAKRVGDGNIEELAVDSNYECAEILCLAVEEDINLLCPAGNGSELTGANQARKREGKEKTPPKQIPKSDFERDDEKDVYICPQGKELVKQGEWMSDGRLIQRYQCHDCKDCPLREQCTTSKKGRSINRYAGDEEKAALAIVMSYPAAQKDYRHRQSTVEPVFSELRGIQGLNRFHRRGLVGVKLEFSLHAMAHNIRRMFAIAARSEEQEVRMSSALSCFASFFAILMAFKAYLRPQNVLPFFYGERCTF